MPTPMQTEIVLAEPGVLVARQGMVPVPAPGEALVRVRSIGVCGTDIHAFHGRQPFFSFPRILGHELGVEVLEISGPANGLKVGDRCAVEPYLNDPQSPASRAGRGNCCENMRVLGVHVDGGQRPLLCVPTGKLHPGPGLHFDQLALVETLCIGAHGVARAQVTAEDDVLIIGAGPIGLAALQSAMVRAKRVAVMDISAIRLAFCRDKLGVKLTLAPGEKTEDDLRALLGGTLPQVVIDATGNARSMAACVHLAAHGGRVVYLGLFQGDLAFHDPTFHRRELTVMASRNALPGDFRTILSAVESGRIDTGPWITHRLTLEEVPEKLPGIMADPSLLKAMIEVP